ncbi:MAG: cytochrome c family protein [Maricaulis sp.]|nr:cytochrome c family protein [Maricaulis sp.]
MSRLFISTLAILSLSACGGDTPEPTAPHTTSEAQAETRVETRAETPVAIAETVEDIGTSGDAETNILTSETIAAAAEPQIDTSAILLALGPDYADADLTNGRRQFRRCQSCHTMNEGGRHTVGPNLFGLMGSAAASSEGYSYSSALTSANLTWDTATLDAWIANPRALVPGNRMSFVGLRDAEDRRDVIGYIAIETAQ